MANSQLYGKAVYVVPANIIQDIRLATKQHPGSKRAGNLLNNPRLSYENAKFTKNFLENTDVDSSEYILAGGKAMLNWLSKELNSDRAEVISRKTTKSNAGFSNQFHREHERTNIKPSHISSSGLKPEKMKRSTLLENEETPMTTVSLGIILNHELKMLIVKRADDDDWMAGKWGLPGGGIEAGETPEVALVREVSEETSLDLENVTICSDIQGSNGTWCSFFMAVAKNADQLQLNYEHSDSKWVTSAEIKDYDTIPDLPEYVYECMSILRLSSKSEK